MDGLSVPLDPDWEPLYAGLVVHPSVIAVEPPPVVRPEHIVFAFWRDLHEHHDAALTDDRRKIVRRALQTYPLPVVLRAVAGGKLDPFMQGRNDQRKVYDDLATLLRFGGRGRNNVEHLAAVFAEQEPDLQEPLDLVARENALGHAAWLAEHFELLDEQAGWVRRQHRKLEREAPRRWLAFQQWCAEHVTSVALEGVA